MKLSIISTMLVALGTVPMAAYADPGGCWALDDGTGSTEAEDSSGNNHDGNLFGDPTWEVNYLDFDGSGDYIEIPNSPDLEPAHVRVEAWVRATNPGSSRYIVGKGGLDCKRASYALYTRGGDLVFYVGDSSAVIKSPAATDSVWDGKWHHVVGRFDGTDVTLSVDGKLIGSTSASSFAIKYDFPVVNLFIGKFGGSCSLEFPGDIQKVQISEDSDTADCFDVQCNTIHNDEDGDNNVDCLKTWRPICGPDAWTAPADWADTSGPGSCVKCANDPDPDNPDIDLGCHGGRPFCVTKFWQEPQDVPGAGFGYGFRCAKCLNDKYHSSQRDTGCTGAKSMCVADINTYGTKCVRPPVRCTGCWGSTSGECQAADTVCWASGHPYAVCPPGTRHCATGIWY